MTNLALRSETLVDFEGCVAPRRALFRQELETERPRFAKPPFRCLAIPFHLHLLLLLTPVSFRPSKGRKLLTPVSLLKV
jgi:hypothetical protein